MCRYFQGSKVNFQQRSRSAIITPSSTIEESLKCEFFNNVHRLQSPTITMKRYIVKTTEMQLIPNKEQIFYSGYSINSKKIQKNVTG